MATKRTVCFACRCYDALDVESYWPSAYCHRCDAFTGIDLGLTVEDASDAAFRLASFGLT